METVQSVEGANAASAGNKSHYYLSKSLYIKGLQCRKALYLEKFRSELKGEISSEMQASFDSGNMVGEAAQDLFPGGVLVPYIENNIPEQLRLTDEAMKNGTNAIYEASFQYDGIFVKVDILHRGDEGWEIYEVKGGTQLKPVYVDDASLQYHVLAGAGVNISKVFISYINNEYVRGKDLNVHKLFICEDITGQIKEKQSCVTEELKEQRQMLGGKIPEISIGPHCFDPYDCDFHDHCWQHIPEDSVFDLRGRGVDKYALYAQGIVYQTDILVDSLNKKQSLQVTATLRQQDTVDKEKVKEFLETLSYPLYFLDFETFMSAIPMYEGVRPYQKVPFQYSLHFQKEKEGELYHKEFLAEPGIDPRKPLLEKLLSDIPEDVCILAYNMAFEKSVLTELADQYPEHAETIEKWKTNMRDLIIPFRQRDVYFWRFKGSYSIKTVLPVLVPELSYEGLKIADGGAAMNAYHEMCASINNPETLEQIRQNLLDYCKLDTLAMVQILDVLGRLV